MAVAQGDTAEAAALGRVRVLSARGAVQGAGVLVMPGVVLTCAHVVAAAIGQGQGQGQGQGRAAAMPTGSVLIDVPGDPDGTAGEASVVPDGWFPGPLSGGSGGDLAVLHTAWAPSDGTAPARVGPCGEPDRREAAVYGFPAGAPDGVWSGARLVGRGGPHRDWIQLEGTGTVGIGIGRGFSGAGVWDPVARRVVGMVTAAYSDARAKTAWMLPLETAARMWPGLVTALGDAPEAADPDPALLPATPTMAPRDQSPPRAPLPPPSDRDQFALADALLNIPQIEDDGGAALRGLLPPRIRRSVRSHPRPRLQLFFLVQACAEHPDGRRSLVEAVRLLDDESRPARAALELIDKLWPTARGNEWS
ncbi:effector-associated domain 2-containing protein [Streptomyces sp. YU58]|uniref:effector-associated domain 2-containing protein n=1 Tax=Streptomyces sp. SX92 TaxID=3158972 RepID=UPI0027B9DC6A|nr:trypsin-like peptidase domain-containing protein [Streptomyces coralus]WLW53058.1 trypsin-like peptidase domain-containing protein [Streptomyces coralus]